MKKRIEHTEIVIEGTKVPVKIHFEKRRGIRASIGKDAAILRLPYNLPIAQQEERKKWLQGWLEKQARKYPRLLDQFIRRVYQSGDELTVGKRKYKILISVENRKTHTGTLENGLIHLKLSQHDEGEHLQKNIRHLISRLVAKDYHPVINFRVNELNQQYFKHWKMLVFL